MNRARNIPKSGFPVVLRAKSREKIPRQALAKHSGIELLKQATPIGPGKQGPIPSPQSRRSIGIHAQSITQLRAVSRRGAKGDNDNITLAVTVDVQIAGMLSEVFPLVASPEARHFITHHTRNNVNELAAKQKLALPLIEWVG